jgi:hypothetical protein
MPSRVDADYYGISSVIPPDTPVNPQPLPILITTNGNPAILSENLLAYEVGYRFGRRRLRLCRHPLICYYR